VAGALLIAAFAFLVVEYDTDVPQFPAVWYLPVLALGTSFALGLIRLATGDRFAATRAATVHLAFFALVAVFLALQGFDTPKAPLIVVGALALDLAANRRLPLAGQALVYVLALYAAYVPALYLFGHGVRLEAADVLVGAPLGFLAVLVSLTLIFRPRGRVRGLRRIPVTGALGLVVLLSLAAPATAHDPGQGEPAGTFDFAAELSGYTLAVSAHRDGGDCPQLVPTELVARRAGDVSAGELVRTGCELQGRVELPDEGRWFVYVDAHKGGETVESWIPVKVEEGETRFVESDRFAYVADREPATTLKWIAGTVMYGLVIAFLVAMVTLVRRESLRGDAAPRRA
jgi:hypothetical protein